MAEEPEVDFLHKAIINLHREKPYVFTSLLPQATVLARDGENSETSDSNKLTYPSSFSFTQTDERTLMHMMRCKASMQLAIFNSLQPRITCMRGSAKHSVMDDFAFLWEYVTFRHLPNENPSTASCEILHS
jgi:hypothetical protein